MGNARTAAQISGDAAEAAVAAHLEAAGWRILGRNVRVGHAEIDLVAVDPGLPPELVVIEVRWRARRDFGLPEETVDHRKRAHLRRAALGLVARGTLPGGEALPRLALRIDLVTVEPGLRPDEPPRLRHHRGAM